MSYASNNQIEPHTRHLSEGWQNCTESHGRRFRCRCEGPPFYNDTPSECFAGKSPCHAELTFTVAASCSPLTRCRILRTRASGRRPPVRHKRRENQVKMPFTDEASNTPPPPNPNSNPDVQVLLVRPPCPMGWSHRNPNAAPSLRHCENR